MGFLIRHYCGWSTVPPPEAGHTALCSHAVASSATLTPPPPCRPPRSNDEPTSKFKGEAGGARGVLERSRELSLVGCSWGASIPCPSLSYPSRSSFLSLCVEYSSRKTTPFSHSLLKLPPRRRMSVATGGTWLWYPFYHLCHSLGSQGFWLHCVSCHFDLPVLFFNRQPSALTSCQKPCTWKTVR